MYNINRKTCCNQSYRFGNKRWETKSPICSAIWYGRWAFIWAEKCRISSKQIFTIWSCRADYALPYEACWRKQRHAVYIGIRQTTHEVIIKHSTKKEMINNFIILQVINSIMAMCCLQEGIEQEIRSGYFLNSYSEYEIYISK